MTTAKYCEVNLKKTRRENGQKIHAHLPISEKESLLSNCNALISFEPKKAIDMNEVEVKSIDKPIMYVYKYPMCIWNVTCSIQ